MTLTETRNMSFTFSMLIHLLMLVVFYFFQINLEYEQKDFLEIDFGSGGLATSSGASGTQLTDPAVKELSEVDKESVSKIDETKNVDLVKTKNNSEDNSIPPIEKKKETTKENTSNKELFGNKTDGQGSMGYDIEWGGAGKRKIYSYKLPEYPGGVQKEADIRLRFSILPDGSVGTIFPLTKADTKLENAAINSLRQWRFEPLNSNQKQVEQFAIIVFPYRLS